MFFRKKNNKIVKPGVAEDFLTAIGYEPKGQMSSNQDTAWDSFSLDRRNKYYIEYAVNKTNIFMKVYKKTRDPEFPKKLGSEMIMLNDYIDTNSAPNELFDIVESDNLCGLDIEIILGIISQRFERSMYTENI